MCLILEEYKPLLFLSINLNRNNNGACIDLIGLLHIIQFAGFLELTHCEKCNIHQRNKLVVSSGKHLLMCCIIFLISLLDRLLVITLIKRNILKLCKKCGMTAVVRPICIQNTDLCHGRISFLLPCKILLDMKEILECHCQIQRIIQFLKLILRHALESVKNCNICRLIKLLYQCLRLLFVGLSGIHRIDTVFLDPPAILFVDLSLKYISCCRPDHRILLFIQELHTPFRGIRSLIKLSRKIFHRKAECIRIHCKAFLVAVIYRRL